MLKLNGLTFEKFGFKGTVKSYVVKVSNSKGISLTLEFETFRDDWVSDLPNRLDKQRLVVYNTTLGISCEQNIFTSWKNFVSFSDEVIDDTDFVNSLKQVSFGHVVAIYTKLFGCDTQTKIGTPIFIFGGRNDEISCAIATKVNERWRMVEEHVFCYLDNKRDFLYHTAFSYLKKGIKFLSFFCAKTDGKLGESTAIEYDFFKCFGNPVGIVRMEDLVYRETPHRSVFRCVQGHPLSSYLNGGLSSKCFKS